MNKNYLPAINIFLTVTILASAIFSTIAFPTPAKAEGSKELVASGLGKRALTEWRTNTTAGLYRRTFFRVYAQAGEYILMGSSGMGVNNGDIVLYTEGQVPNSQITPAALAAITPTFNCNGVGVGVLNTRAKELQGATRNGGADGGYTPCIYTVPVGGTGTYWVAMYGPDGVNGNADGAAGTIAAPVINNTQASGVSMWDITVRNGASAATGTDKPGRVFVDYLAQISGGNGAANQMYPTIYALTADGYVYKVDMNGFDPNGYVFYGNRVGFLDPDGQTPLYNDAQYTDNTLAATQGGVILAPASAKIFFNNPLGTDLPSSILPTPINPSINNVSYQGTAYNNTGYFNSGGQFTYTGNVGGISEIIISRDGVDFLPDTPTNRRVLSQSVLGSNTVIWDGKDNQGIPFPVGNGYAYKVIFHAGEYHFPMLDSENSLNGGPIFTLLNPIGGVCPFNVNCHSAFYDDRGYRVSTGAIVGTVGVTLPGDANAVTPPTINHSNWTTGFDTSTNQRAYGDGSGNGFGNWKGLNLWTYYPISVIQSVLNIIDPVSQDLQILKTHNGTFNLGSSGGSFTIDVNNVGSSLVPGQIVVTDTLPTGLTPASATTPGGSGWNACTIVGQTVSCTHPNAAGLAAGASLQLITITVDVSASAAPSATNTASLSNSNDANASNNQSSDTVMVNVLDLSITKTDGVASVNSGGTTAYAIVMFNSGPSAANNAIFTDPAITGLNVTSVTCGTSTGGAACPASVDTTVILMQGSGIVIPTLPSGGSVTFTVNATVTAASGSLANVANVAAPALSTDLTPGNNSATDTDTISAPSADLAVTKTDGTGIVTSGSATTYTLTLTNNGPSAANNATISDPVAAGLIKTAIGPCTAAGGAVCPTLTIANLQAGVSVPTLPIGGSISFTVIATVTAASGNVTNTYTATTPGGTTDPTPGNNTATDTDTVASAAACTSTAFTRWTFAGNVTTPALGSGTFSYDTTNQTTLPTFVNSDIPANNPALSLLNWPVAFAAGQYYMQFTVPTTGRSNINLSFIHERVNANSGPQTVRVYYSTDGGTNWVWFPNNTTYATQNGTFSTVSVDFSSIPALDNNPNAVFRLYAYGGTTLARAWVVDNVSFTGCPTADLMVTKTNGVASVAPGVATIYTVRVTNNGPTSVTGAILSDPAVTGLTKTAVACSATPGQCTVGTTPTLAQLQSGTFPLPALASTQFYEIRVTANVTAANGNVTNAANVVAPISVDDLIPANNTASDTDPVITPNPDLTITNTNNVGGSVTLGNSFNWTLTASNAGSVAATFTTAAGQTILSEQLPAGATYGAPTPANFTNITNSANISCSINGSNLLTCVASGASVTIGATTGSFTVTFSANPTTVGSLSGTVIVDPNSNITESNEINNISANTVTVSKASPTMTTTAITTELIGNNITDVAHLIGGSGTLGGTVSFEVFAPGDTTCLLPIPVTPAIAVSGAGNYTSANYRTLLSGIYRWRAYYSGDVNNNPVSGACNDTSETSTVTTTTISGQVRNDINHNGLLADSESGISGVTITLKQGAVTIATTTTDASGNYSFANLVSGNYTVVETNPASYVSTNDSDGNATLDVIAVTVVASTPYTANDFLDTNRADVSGQVRNDTNNNGLLTDVESGIAGITVTLKQGATTIATTITDASGNYTFANQVSDNYTVEETNPNGFFSTNDKDGGGNGLDVIAVTLVANVNNTTNDFLDTQPSENFGHLPSSYSGMNLLADGGAYHLTGTTYLGASVTTATDGINNATYTPKASDDGVTWTPSVTWSVATGGSVNVTVTCPVATCYLNAWFDWTKDGVDFNDTGEQIFNNQAVVNGVNTLTFSIPAGTVLNGDTFYSRFRIYPSQPTSPSPNGAALNGTTLLAGEIEDPLFQIVSGNVPTPVTLSYFLAQRQGNKINFIWSTATETGNVGFNLYVKSGQKMTQINKTLIPSKVINSLDRQDYSFNATVKGNTFFIEDVSVLGELDMHGPFKIGEKYGDRMEADKIDQAAIQAEHEEKYDDQQKELEQQLTVPAAAREAVNKSIRPTPTVKPTKPTKPTKTPRTPKPTATPSPTMTVEQTATPTETLTPTPTATPTETPTATGEPTATEDPLTIEEPTVTGDPAVTDEPTATEEPTATFEPTATETFEPTATPTFEPTETATFEPTATETFEPTATETTEPIDPQLKVTYNFKVRQTGIYRVTYEMLRDSGLDLAGVPSMHIALTNLGQAVPVYVNTPNEAFGAGSFIEFYGEALDTIYTDTNIYTLQVSDAPVEKIQSDNTAPNMDLVSPVSYTETFVVNNPRAYAEYAPGIDVWYDTAMFVYTTSKSWSFPFTVNGKVASSASQSFELVVWGVTDFPAAAIDHHLLVSINGVKISDESFNGLMEKTIKVNLPTGLLHEGGNTLQLTLPADTGVGWDMINLDKYSISYQRPFTYTGGQLTFTSTGNVFNVTNLTSSNVVVYRMDNKGIVHLNGVSVQANGVNHSAKFAGTNAEAKYVVTTAENVLTPMLEATRLQVDLNRHAQYLIISHPDFIDGLGPLIHAREAQGLTVSVVNVADLYTQYNYGIFDPQAIRKYIAYARKNLGTQYVLLVGGDTYDYRNYLGRNSISFIPSLYAATGPSVKLVPVDQLFADVDGDNVPDLAIGRFPVRTRAELDLIINKTLSYAAKNYGRSAVFASDKFDGIESYKNISNDLASSLPADWVSQSIHLDDVPMATAKQQLIAAMNTGTALVTFTGHSGPTQWTFSNLFSTADAAALTNAGRPFVAVQWGCWNTYYVDPVNNYLVQSLLFSGDKGAAAVLGAVTLTDSQSEALLGALLTPRMATPGKPIGLAMQEAKAELALTHPELLDVLLGWSLMGDPALVIQQ